MRIAILGWGSLIWDPRELRYQGEWEQDGPSLPIEFSRKSDNGRLTLVIDKENGQPVPTQFVQSSFADLDNAIENLRCRENTSRRNIGSVNLLDRATPQCNHPDIGQIIQDWGTQHGFEAVIWTDLSPKFGNDPFTIENAIQYLKSSSPEKARDARRYISNAPIEVMTPLRRKLLDIGWLDEELEAIMTDRRFIEESFPVKEVGEASAREKSIRHGHISTLHIWWARRPLAASRATAYAALTPAPKDIEEWDRKRKFIIELCQWENSNNQPLFEKARQEILAANGGVPPKVLDPFAGGGSYPLESLRLGCETYANDYNPVAVLIEKATLEYPQKFGRPFEGMPEWAKDQRKDAKVQGRKGEQKQLDLLDPSAIENPKSKIENPLLNAVRYWGNWVMEEARKELAEFYLPDPDGNIPVGYIWARTIPCQNPACGEEFPLMRQFWLANTAKKKVALKPEIAIGKLQFRVIDSSHQEWPKDFDAGKGTVARAIATCPLCGNVVGEETTRKLFRDGNTSQKLIAVVLTQSHSSGKKYRIAQEKDIQVYNSANKKLQIVAEEKYLKWGINPIPDETLPLMSGVFNVPIYGLNTWGALFNSRQLLSLITFADLIRNAYLKILDEDQSSEFARAIVTYLALAFDKIVDYNSNVQSWHNTRELVGHTFTRQALQMVWDYAESSPIGGSFGDWLGAIEWVLSLISLDKLVGILASCCIFAQTKALF